MTDCNECNLNEKIDVDLLKCCLALKKRNLDIPTGAKLNEILAYYEKFRKEIFHNGDKMVDSIQISEGQMHCSMMDLYIQARYKERTDEDTLCLLHGMPCHFFILHLSIDDSLGGGGIIRIFILRKNVIFPFIDH